MDLSLSTDGIPQLQSDFADYPNRVQRGIVRSLNRAIKSGQTVMVRAIAQDTGLKSGDVRNAMRLKLASVASPEASLGTSLARIPLIDFGAKQTRRGVTYKLQGGRSRIENAFIATMGSGHVGVFARASKARLPIKELFGPSLGHVFGKFRPMGIARVDEVLMTNLDHELDFASKEANASGTD